MHLELPKTRLSNFKDFAKHYLMIVLSILTALGLEAWIEHVHHQQAAAFAKTQIENELRASLDDLQNSKQVDQARVATLQALDDEISKDIRDKVPNDVINQRIQSRHGQFQLSLRWASFNTQAWDVAIANQSATWIDPVALRRYSQAYTEARAASDWMVHDATIPLNAPQLEALQTNIKLGIAVDPIQYVSVLNQMLDITKETVSHLEQVQVPLQKALAGDPAKNSVAN
jgi:hypothetical protein